MRRRLAALLVLPMLFGAAACGTDREVVYVDRDGDYERDDDGEWEDDD